MPAARQTSTEQLQRADPATPRTHQPPGEPVNLPIGRIPVLDVRPAVDCGRRPAKAVAGETFMVTATVFREGHDSVAANVVLRDPRGRPGPWTPMRELAPGSDRWGAEVTPAAEGRWSYTVEAWSDPVATWRRYAGIKIPAGLDTDLVLAEGAALYERAARGVPKTKGREAVLAAVDALRDGSRPPAARLAAPSPPRPTRPSPGTRCANCSAPRSRCRSWSSASGRSSVPGTSCSRAPRARWSGPGSRR